MSGIARTFLDEQGVHVIYAVFGWLNWVDESRPPHYTDQELLRALSLACFEVGSIPKADLIRFTARFLGFPRVAKKIAFRLESLVSEAIQEEYLREDGERYLPGAQSKSHFTVVDEETPKTREERIAGAVIGLSREKPAITKLHPKQPVSFTYDRTVICERIL